MSAAIDEEKLLLCSICLHLCRDTCPVATWSGRSDLVPSNKSRSAAAALGVGPGGEVYLELLDACTDCGACTAFCALEVPVAEHPAGHGVGEAGLEDHGTQGEAPAQQQQGAPVDGPALPPAQHA